MDNKPYGFIYKITNRINSKIYIGQAKDVNLRWYEHRWEAKHYNQNNRFKNAIRKYGSENFIVEVIDSAFSKDELNYKEMFWIRDLRSQDEEIGYNTTAGGEGACIPEHLNMHNKEVICLETGDKFKNVKSANMWLKNLGVKGAFISACLSGKQKTCGGYHWAIADADDIAEMLNKYKGKPRNLNPHACPMTEEKMIKIKAANHLRVGKTHDGNKTICLENGLLFRNKKLALRWKILNDPKYNQDTGYICGEYHLVSLSEYLNYSDVITIDIPTIYCEELDQYFYTLTEAASKLNIPGSAICATLSGRQNSCRGYHFCRKVLTYTYSKPSVINFSDDI